MALIPERPLSVLVFAPTPTHPPVQGNRQRVLDMCRAMQSMGADLTLLYYAVDGIDAAAVRSMKQAWGSLEVVFPRGFAPAQTLVRSPAIDDWYDPEISSAAIRLSEEKHFDVCFVNYVWYSQIFESLPADIVRVVDTHDVFGGRIERFTELDIDPEWFHTSVAQEAIGLDRADFVLAIQDVEAETLRARTKTNVQTVGFLSAPDYLSPPVRKANARLRAGYLGSGNPFNVSSILSLSRALQSRPEAADRLEVHVAGPICASLARVTHPFITHGIVNSVADFYRSIDVVVNPMIGGTGLKIKSLEALSFGKPLVATSDAMTGIESDHGGHRLADSAGIVQQLLDLSGNSARLAEEAEMSRNVFETYRRHQLRQFSSWWSRVEHKAYSRRGFRQDEIRKGAA